jgi:hypothetical protein
VKAVTRRQRRMNAAASFNDTAIVTVPIQEKQSKTEGEDYEAIERLIDSQIVAIIHQQVLQTHLIFVHTVVSTTHVGKEKKASCFAVNVCITYHKSIEKS